MIQELLQRWSELEPSQCEKQSVSYWIAAVGYSVPLEHLTMIDLALVTRGLMNAIAERKIPCRIENGENRWFVIVAKSLTPKIELFPSHHDEECAIALLKAYVAYLEAQA